MRRTSIYRSALGMSLTATFIAVLVATNLKVLIALGVGVGPWP